QRLAERLHHDHGLDRAGAEAAVVFGEGKTEQALLGELAPHRLAPAALLLHVLLALLELVSIGQQPVDALLEKALLLGQIEIHVSFLSPAFQFSSCRALGRASTSFSRLDVDGRVKPGHDGGVCCSRYDVKAPAPPW